MKFYLKWILCITLCFAISPVRVQAQDHDYDDKEYWNNLCNQDGLTTEQRQACKAFMMHESKDLKDKIAEIDAKREDISKNIQAAAEKVRGYQGQVNALGQKIAELNGQIAVKEKEIEELQKDIEKNEADIEKAKGKLKQRISSTQETMRLNPMLDILMGARDFEDFVRIANGIRDITEYDEKSMEKLAEQIAKLNADKAKVEEDKKQLDVAKDEVVENQNQILLLKYEAQQVEDELKAQFVELQAEGNRYAANIGAIQERMKELDSQLNDVPNASGFVSAIPNSHVSAGTWHYPGTSYIHLGCDYAAPTGSPVQAVGNGVILASNDGCGPGWLGNTCGANGGVLMGGNQVRLLTKVNGGLYAVLYCHLLAGSPIKSGTIVNAGDVVGLVGQSGNTTGPHSHIEVYYLGSADNFSNYAKNWNGDLSFGCGWGKLQGMNRRCEAGAGAPCRMRPETLF